MIQTIHLLRHGLYTAAAKSLQPCRTLCDPIDGSHQALPSLGFSRQEHWSGLPFPSPMQESEKWKWSRSVVSDPQPPNWLQPSRLLHPWDFPGKSTWLRCHCLLQPSSMGLYRFTFPPTVQEHFLCSTLSPAFIVCRLFDDDHSDWCEVISHCSFDLHFSNNVWCWTSFHVFVSHLYALFGEMSV